MLFLLSLVSLLISHSLVFAAPTSTHLTRRACYIDQEGIQLCTGGAGGIIVTSNERVKRQCFVDRTSGEQFCSDSHTTVVTNDGQPKSGVVVGKKDKRQCFILETGVQICHDSTNTIVTNDGAVAEDAADEVEDSEDDAAPDELPVTNDQVIG